MYDINYIGSTMNFYKFDSAETTSAKKNFIKLMKLAAYLMNEWVRLPLGEDELRDKLWGLANDPNLNNYLWVFNEHLDVYRQMINDTFCEYANKQHKVR